MEPITALVAEDDPDLRRFLQHFLRTQNCRALTARNGRDAVEIVNSNRIQFLLTDIDMPVMDGIAAITLLRKSGFAQPIMALTADISPQLRPRVLAAGANECLLKPVSLKALGTWIQSIRTLVMN